MSNQQGITPRTFAILRGLSESFVVRCCRDGRIVGARKNPLTKKWIIFPPAQLAPSRGSL